nr:alpha/beta hydrolase [Corynebacterium marambiense]
MVVSGHRVPENGAVQAVKREVSAVYEGFDTIRVPVPGATIHARTGGAGPAVLLLHGYPQTHAMWHRMAPYLAEDHFVVIPDLRGYGQSAAHDGDFSFRTMAADFIALMAHLGKEQFHVVAHDRGARAAYRMALDHPDAVLSVALLDILPTYLVWDLMNADLAKRYFHWVFLSQPEPLPQRLIGGDPLAFVRAQLAGMAGTFHSFDPEALQDYENAALRPEVIAAWCGDYAAGATIDVEHDRADLDKISDIPALVLWGDQGVVGRQVDPLDAWRAWFPRVRGGAVNAGHFVVEENLEEVLPAVTDHLRQATGSAGC